MPVRPFLATAAAVGVLAAGTSWGSASASVTAPAGPARAANVAVAPVASPKKATLTIRNFAFGPAKLTVAPGATITIRNKDGRASHTVTEKKGRFDTGDIDPLATKKLTAPRKAGTYSYVCSNHDEMKATLVVKKPGPKKN